MVRRAPGDFYDLRAACLFPLACWSLGDPPAAQDAVWEVSLQWWIKSGDHNPAQGGPLAWPELLARNCATDRQRGSGWLRPARGAGEGGPAVVDEPLTRWGPPGDVFRWVRGLGREAAEAPRRECWKQSVFRPVESRLTGLGGAPDANEGDDLSQEDARQADPREAYMASEVPKTSQHGP